MAQVIRSYVHSVGHTESGTSTLLYRAGLVFNKLDDEDRDFLEKFIAQNLEGEEGFEIP